MSGSACVARRAGMAQLTTATPMSSAPTAAYVSGSVERMPNSSAFFFRDEVPAVLESVFGPADRAHSPSRPVAEGADSQTSGPLARQITGLATQLLPHAEVVRVTGTNHMMPLPDPEALARIIHAFVRRHS